MKVYVYYNLRRRCWSVRHAGRVWQHCRRIALTDCTFRVNEAGRLRVLRDRQKNVHAGVSGKVTEQTPGCTREVRYNPYNCATFVDLQGEPVYAAPAALLVDGKVFVPRGCTTYPRQPLSPEV